MCVCQLLYTTSTRDTVYLNLFYYSKHFRYSSAAAAAVVGFFRFRLALCGTSLAVIVLYAAQTNRFTSNSDDNQKKNRSRTVPYAVVCFCLSVGGGNFNSTALLLCDDHLWLLLSYSISTPFDAFGDCLSFSFSLYFYAFFDTKILFFAELMLVFINIIIPHSTTSHTPSPLHFGPKQKIIIFIRIALRCGKCVRILCTQSRTRRTLFALHFNSFSSSSS